MCNCLFINSKLARSVVVQAVSTRFRWSIFEYKYNIMATYWTIKKISTTTTVKKHLWPKNRIVRLFSEKFSKKLERGKYCLRSVYLYNSNMSESVTQYIEDIK